MAESSTPVYEAETVIKNEYDFRREILKALDNEFPSPSDAKDTELFRKRLLYALNQEFDQDDIKQTDRFRGKFVKGISELAGGGGGIPETATVTFTNNNRVSAAVRYVHVNPNTGELSAAQTNTISQGNSQTINRILVGSLLYSTVAGTNSTSTTGDITTTDKQSFHINGDGTITLG